jgi:hypothetical protein
VGVSEGAGVEVLDGVGDAMTGATGEGVGRSKKSAQPARSEATIRIMANLTVFVGICGETMSPPKNNRYE